MTTSVRERPAPARSAADGGAAARRAVIRWAWRLFRREWRQQLLVLSLITVAVAGTVLGAAVASNTPASPAAATFGTANHLASIPGSQPHLAADIAAIRRRFGPVDVIENQNLVTGSASQVQLRAQNPAPATRRNLTAVTAGALGLLGALTGTALAYLTAISWFGHASVIAATAPAAELAVILAGLPLAAAIGGWLFAGRQPPAIARQPLE